MGLSALQQEMVAYTNHSRSTAHGRVDSVWNRRASRPIYLHVVLGRLTPLRPLRRLGIIQFKLSLPINLGAILAPGHGG